MTEMKTQKWPSNEGVIQAGAQVVKKGRKNYSLKIPCMK